MDFPQTTVEKLRAYCRTKPGSEETLNTFGKHKPTFQLLGGFLDSFARFYIYETPVKLELRCTLERLIMLQPHYPAITVSHRMRWETVGWKWTEVRLDDSVAIDELLRLLDESYTLAFDALCEHDKQFIRLNAEALSSSERFKRLLELHQLTHRQVEIEALIRPAISLQAHRTDDEQIPIGYSKIGGLPDFPPGVKWPFMDEFPSAFVAQINLAQISPEVNQDRLPEHGLLSFFSVNAWQLEDGDIPADLPWERATSQVLYFTDEASTLKRHPKPNEVDMRVFPSAEVIFETTSSLPRASDSTRDPVLLALGWSEQEYEHLDDLYFDFAYDHDTNHQMLGYAGSMQETVAVLGNVLLLEIGSDLALDLMWGDGGSLYFTISETDLRQHNFTDVCGDFQTC